MSVLFSEAPSVNLLASDLFRPIYHDLSSEEKVAIAYQRAREIARFYALTVDDVLNVTDKLFMIHCDPIHVVDMASLTILTIQYNLAAGTIAPFVKSRADLRGIMQQIMSFEVSMLFMLTEVGHGLDARAIETTATLLPNGHFDIHTPCDAAAKFMPPTGPTSGIPKIGLVFARLIVDGEDRGIRPFIVPLNDGQAMCKGVKAMRCPSQADGSKSVGHTITYFDHIEVPESALLGSLDKPLDERRHLMEMLWRVPVRGIVLALAPIISLSISTVVAARYSLRRMVSSDSGALNPIWSFKTQQVPILHALARAYVMKAHALEAIRLFRDDRLELRVRFGVSTAYKAVATQQSQESLVAMSERMGVQGLYKHNIIIATQLETRGISIAEGDVLALSIRLGTELLIGRYGMPKPRFPDCLLAKHEASIFSSARRTLEAIGGHREPGYNDIILPLCQKLVDAIGHRMAYEAAVDAQVHQGLIDLYEIGAIKSDAAWYSECAGIDRWEQHEREMEVAGVLLPVFEDLLQGLHVEPFAAIAPITAAEGWNEFLGKLRVEEGSAHADMSTSPLSRSRLGRDTSFQNFARL